MEIGITANNVEIFAILNFRKKEYGQKVMPLKANATLTIDFWKKLFT